MSQPDDTTGNYDNIIEWQIYLIQKDPLTGAQDFIDQIHQEIHDGNHFTVCILDADVDDAPAKYVRITTPDTNIRVHWLATISSNNGILYEFFEDPTVNVAGSSVTPLNNERNSSTEATATVFEDTTTTDDGLLLCAGYISSGSKKATAEADSRQEWVLKQNEDYIIKITADSNDTTVIITMTWYEEPEV